MTILQTPQHIPPNVKVLSSIETRQGLVWLGDDNILRSVYTDPKTEIDLKDAIEGTEAILTLSGNKRYPIYNDGRNLKYATTGARKHFASEKNIDLTLANATRVESAVTQTIMNFFITFNRPRFPFKIFKDEASAIAWLKEFLPPQPR